MTSCRTALWTAAFLLGALPAAGPAQVAKNDRAEVLLEAAKHKALVDGDLEGAIKLCEKIVAEHNGNRATAAKALVHMGQCYEKLGNARARQAYEQVMRDYADQALAVSTARQRLAAIAQEPDADANERVMLRELEPDFVPIGIWATGFPPDGRYYTFDDTSTWDLLVRNLTTGEDLRLVENEEPRSYFCSGPMISPDNKWVAYFRQKTITKCFYWYGEYQETRTGVQTCDRG